MALHTVRYSKISTFIKDAKGLSVNKYDDSGNILQERDYKLNFLPKVGRNYKVKTRNGKKLINLTQDKLNEIVEKIGFYDEDGNLITQAPLRNTTAKFWKHPKLNIWLEAVGTNIDDEDPLGYFWLKAFEADPEFRLSTDPLNPAMSQKIKYSVSRVGTDQSDKATKIDEVLKATEYLGNMDFVKQTNILRAMGVDIRKPDETTVKRSLMVKITDQKDLLGPSGERYIEQFLRLSEETPKALNIEAQVKQARNMRIITKRADGYYYGEVFMGKVIKDVTLFLEDEDNSELFTEIMRDIKNNG